MKYIIHEKLECGGSISEPERHHQIFESPVSRSERSFPFMTFRYPHVIVSCPKVDLGEDLCLPQLVYEVSDKRERISILPCDLIEGAIVHTESKRAILLLYEKNGSSSRRARRANKP